MYKAEVYASGNREGAVRTFYAETYSWPAMRAALAGVREEFAWIFVNQVGNKITRIREPQPGETYEHPVGTEAQFKNGFMGTLVLSNTED